MRVLVTGGSGFVGSNVVHVLADRHGAEVLAPAHAELDLTDAAAVARTFAGARPDAVVHAAIWNDPAGLLADRRRAWDGYVGATRNVVDAANATGAHVVLVSTDWVFDGSSPPAPAPEDEPPNPVNTYGFLKAASELVVSSRAERGTVARIAAVQGVHRARVGGGGFPGSRTPASATSSRRSSTRSAPGGRSRSGTTPGSTGAPRRCWRPTPRELIWRAIVGGVTGTLHCVGAEHVDRVELARRAVAAFGLDAELLRVGAPDEAVFGAGAVPCDTRLDAAVTARRLGVELPDLDTTLRRLQAELETVGSPA